MFYISLIVGVVAGVVAMNFAMSYVVKRSGKKALTQGEKAHSWAKKYPSVSVDKFSGMLLNVGLILSVGAILLAFEHKEYDAVQVDLTGMMDMQTEEIKDIPITEQVPPPPPKIELPEIIEVPDEEEIKEELDLVLTSESTDDFVIADVPIVTEFKKPVEKVDEIFTVVEDPATPIGGYEEFYKFIAENVKYPRQAKRMGVQGKVFLQFVIDKDGSITDIQVLKGIGAGCDEEAVRVLSEAPKWKPGKQRGIAVKQRVSFPFDFKLR